MAIGIKCGSALTEIGPGAILHALFSTIGANLEPTGWGTSFPLVMRHLYQGSLPSTDAEPALAELAEIQSELGRVPLTRVVWDIERPNESIPSEYRPNPEATSLANFFFTVNGRDLLAELIENVCCAAEMGQSLEIVSLDHEGRPQ